MIDTEKKCNWKKSQKEVFDWRFQLSDFFYKSCLQLWNLKRVPARFHDFEGSAATLENLSMSFEQLMVG